MSIPLLVKPSSIGSPGLLEVALAADLTTVRKFSCQILPNPFCFDRSFKILPGEAALAAALIATLKFDFSVCVDLTGHKKTQNHRIIR